jgi:potassium-transporting ATPase KdpC subunit
VTGRPHDESSKERHSMRDLLISFRACIVTFIVCSVAYPAVVWGLAQLAFPRQAAGSLIYGRDGEVIGSELIAQPFATDRYFHPRPSAADYKADAASGSNLGPNSPDLRKKVEERVADLKASEDRKAPVDLVTASGSGLDPHISPEAARFQAQRVAASRGLALAKVEALIVAHVDRTGAILGAPARVNVLKLNLDLDDRPAAAQN